MHGGKIYKAIKEYYLGPGLLLGAPADEVHDFVSLLSFP